MEYYFLKLLCFNKSFLKLELFDESIEDESLNTNIITSSKKINVYSDCIYEFELEFEDISQIQDVKVYINDDYEKSVYDSGIIKFFEKNGVKRRIFLDCYGYVRISFVILMNNGQKKHLSSRFIHVLVKRGALNDAVKAMVDYVYKHQERLLFSSELKIYNFSALKENGMRDLNSRIILAKKIVGVYENNYGYFKVNSRVHIKKYQFWIDWKSYKAFLLIL